MEKALELIARVDPYSDGSGYAAVAKVHDGDDGTPALSIEICYQISISKWPELRAAIDDLVALAEKRASR